MFRSMLEEATNNGMVSDSSVDIGLFGGYRTLRWVSDSSVGIGLFVGLSDNVVSDVTEKHIKRLYLYTDV